MQLFPNLEIGVGDDFTIIAPMIEIDYCFQEKWGSWSPYFGGGFGPVFLFRSRPARDDTELGLTMQGGIKRRMARARGSFLLEFKLGLLETPDFKFTAGWTFGSSRGERTPDRANP